MNRAERRQQNRNVKNISAVEYENLLCGKIADFANEQYLNNEKGILVNEKNDTLVVVGKSSDLMPILMNHFKDKFLSI